jgi:branched-chain amino acid aminotransferase
MKLTQTPETLHSEIQKTLDAFFKQNPKTPEAYIRVIISRGVGKIGFGLENVTSGTQMVIIALPLEEPTAEARKKGIRLKIVERLRNHPKALNPAMKSGNYLNCLLAFLEAKEEGFDDAILLNEQGFVTEGTTFNIFAIQGSTLLTPPLEIGILAGITRAKILKLAQDLGLTPIEKNFKAEELLNSDEIFITGTVKEVLGVSKLNLRTYPVGPKTLALYNRFREIIAHE